MAILTENEEDELLRLLDKALVSNNPTVKQALKNLMLVTALVEVDDAEPHAAILSSFRHTQQELKAQVEQLEKTVADIQSRTRYFASPTENIVTSSDINNTYLKILCSMNMP